MKRWTHPALWWPLALAGLTAGGSLLLYPDACLRLSERDRHSYGERPRWQTAFDALSATAGVGLLTYNLEKDYTLLGGWVLTGLGVAGAMLYLTAARQALARGRPDLAPRLPTTRRILLVFVIGLLAAALVAVGVERARGGLTANDAAFNAVAAFASLGWQRGAAAERHHELYAVLAWVGAIGWPLWLLGRQRIFQHRRLWCALGGYVVFLAVSAALIVTLEVPRGGPRGEASPDARLASQTAMTRLARALTQVAAGAGAGLPVEPLGDRAVGEGTKLVLAIDVFVGGFGGSAGGGLHWLTLWAILGSLGGGRGSGTGRPFPTRAFALAGALGVALLIMVLGLFVIEAQIGSPYQSPPTLGDALLEAASATCGAGLTTGLTRQLTGVTLSSGIRRPVDVYMYGMAWLMAAMFIGRVLPVLVIGRAEAADARPPNGPAAI